MAKKTAKRAAKSASKPKENTEVKNDLLTKEQMKKRDEMLEALDGETDNQDLQGIITIINACEDEQAEQLKQHYVKNGSLYINAIFNGDTKKAIEYASDNDKGVL